MTNPTDIILCRASDLALSEGQRVPLLDGKNRRIGWATVRSDRTIQIELNEGEDASRAFLAGAQADFGVGFQVLESVEHEDGTREYQRVTLLSVSIGRHP